MDDIQVLVISNDSNHLLAAVDLAFRDCGYRVETVSSTEQAVEALREGPRDFLLIDLPLSPPERLVFLNRVQVLSPSAAIMIFAGQNDADLLLDDAGLCANYSLDFVRFLEDRELLCGG